MSPTVQSLRGRHLSRYQETIFLESLHLDSIADFQKPETENGYLSVQVESVQLSSESTTKHLEAELAVSKLAAAQAASAHKAAFASWQTELDHHKSEVNQFLGLARLDHYADFN